MQRLLFQKMSAQGSYDNTVFGNLWNIEYEMCRARYRQKAQQKARDENTGKFTCHCTPIKPSNLEDAVVEPSNSRTVPLIVFSNSQVINSL